MKVHLRDCTPVRLTPDYSIKSFDCGEADLSEFLFEEAKSYLGELMAVTYLFEYRDITVAFYSVSNDKIIYDTVIFPSKSAWQKFCKVIPHKKRRRELPAVKLGRLGVHSDYQCHGIGTEILDVIKTSFTTENKTGCRFITVDAYNNNRTIDFYRHNQFEFLTPKDETEKTRLMYFDLKRFIEAANFLF